MIAAVTDLTGRVTGVHRTWLDPSGVGQGADRYAAPGDGPSPWAWRPLRRGGRHPAGRRRHRNHPVAAHGLARPCPCSPRSPPTTSPPSCSRHRCDASTSRGTPIQPAAQQPTACSPGPAAPASTPSCSRRSSATSTTTCAISASARSMQRCGPARTGGRGALHAVARMEPSAAEARSPACGVMSLAGEAARPGLREGDRTAGEAGPQRRPAAFFPCREPHHVGARRGIPRADKKAAGPPSSAALRPLSLCSAVQTRPARRRVIATKAAMGAADSDKGHHHGDRSRRPATSSRPPPFRQPIRFSPNCSSTVTAPSRTNRIRDHCPTPTPSWAPSQTSSTRW